MLTSFQLYVSDSAQGLLLAVLRGPPLMPGIGLGLAACKASALPAAMLSI